MIKKISQKKLVLDHLTEGRTITPLEALRLYDCFRLSDVVYKLKKDGVPVQTRIITTDTGKHVAEYYL